MGRGGGPGDGLAGGGVGGGGKGARGELRHDPCRGERPQRGAEGYKRLNTQPPGGSPHGEKNPPDTKPIFAYLHLTARLLGDAIAGDPRLHWAAPSLYSLSVFAKTNQRYSPLFQSRFTKSVLFLARLQ